MSVEIRGLTKRHWEQVPVHSAGGVLTHEAFVAPRTIAMLLRSRAMNGMRCDATYPRHGPCSPCSGICA